VDARKRYPASGIAYAEDLILTADHAHQKRSAARRRRPCLLRWPLP
jgi:hypothetical protein